MKRAARCLALTLLIVQCAAGMCLAGGASLNYTLMNIPSGSFYVFAMKGSSKKHQLGCALFRKTAPSEDSEWVSAQFIINNTWMVLTKKQRDSSPISPVDLYIDDMKISRLERDEKNTTYYLDLQDFARLVAGEGLYRAPSKRRLIVNSGDAAQMARVIRKCLPKSMF